ncbi:hypothetical protein CesoFtcFv8_013407 [Champsocephalus esox]|uniref:Uncharacterized protein n=1 Tax=Champsocephalus esox TaxID=159716 RepID=A0AAN8BQU3_9TELE|nr:hypothetical protein CesoFtcFv8_013407 [Champsocephalus esox]
MRSGCIGQQDARRCVQGASVCRTRDDAFAEVHTSSDSWSVPLRDETAGDYVCVPGWYSSAKTSERLQNAESSRSDARPGPKLTFMQIWTDRGGIGSLFKLNVFEGDLMFWINALTSCKTVQAWK